MKEIIEQNKGVVKAVIRKITGAYNEDLEQEVYIKTWRNLQNYEEKGKISAWIAQIAANVCKDYFKSKAYKREKLEIAAEEVLQNKAIQPVQEKIIDAKARQKIILKAVDALPAKMRKVIVLFEFEDYTIEQIAAKLREPEGTIKSRLHNGRKILAEKLKFLQKILAEKLKFLQGEK